MLRIAILAALLTLTGAAQACGYCVEDKMAAAYDHAVVTRALAQKHKIAFFHIDGVLVSGDATKQALEAIAGAAAGADRGSVRVSVASASLSVAFDPQRTTLGALHKDLERRLAARKLSLMLLQVMDRPAEFSPSVTASMKRERR